MSIQSNVKPPRCDNLTVTMQTLTIRFITVSDLQKGDTKQHDKCGNLMKTKVRVQNT